MNELQIFNNPEFGTIRTITIDNEVWFVGKDLAYILRYADINKAVTAHVDECDRKALKYKASDKTTEALWTTPNDFSDKILINESGMYSLVFGSKLPTAKMFKKWVTSVVLPSIRKNGGYIVGQESMTPEQIVANALIVAQNIISDRDKQIAEMKPKAEFFDAVADSKTAISMNEVAKVLAIKGYGRNRLFEFLRKAGVLNQHNVPYQKYVDAGWFRVIEQKYTKYGEQHISIKTLVYQKGVDGIRKMLLRRIA